MLDILVTSCSGIVMQAKGEGAVGQQFGWIIRGVPYNSKDNKNTMYVYLVTAMTHVIALEAGQSSQGALKPITTVQLITNIVIYFQKDTLSFYHLTCICHPACIFPPLLGDRDIKANIPPPPPPASNAQQCEGCYL